MFVSEIMTEPTGDKQLSMFHFNLCFESSVCRNFKQIVYLVVKSFISFVKESGKAWVSMHCPTPPDKWGAKLFSSYSKRTHWAQLSQHSAFHCSAVWSWDKKSFRKQRGEIFRSAATSLWPIEDSVSQYILCFNATPDFVSSGNLMSFVDMVTKRQSHLTHTVRIYLLYTI